MFGNLSNYLTGHKHFPTGLYIPVKSDLLCFGSCYANTVEANQSERVSWFSTFKKKVLFLIQFVFWVFVRVMNSMTSAERRFRGKYFRKFERTKMYAGKYKMIVSHVEFFSLLWVKEQFFLLYTLKKLLLTRVNKPLQKRQQSAHKSVCPQKKIWTLRLSLNF